MARPHRIALVAASLLLAACSGPAAQPGAATGPASGGGPSPTAGTSPAQDAGTEAAEQAALPVRLRANVPPGGRTVPVHRMLEVTARDGTLASVEVRYGPRKDLLAGALDEDGTRWTATDRLEPGLRYTVHAVAVDADGERTTRRIPFRTDDLTLAQQTFPSIAPLDGETVGVGMPVIVAFDVPVTDRAAIERHLSVRSRPKQVGSWHWLSDSEVHWRPRSYWRPGTRVTVEADINSIKAGPGVWGQLSRTTSFEVGDRMISRVDVARHRMRVYRNGTLLRTMPISAGKPGFTTRSGVKVVMEKHRTKRMDAATTGIDESDPEYYDIEDVEYALRVTHSGEFLHAAPWSVGSQGSANVSHGCVGMSTSDAGWVYGLTRRGDVVVVTGTERTMTLDNGWGDWNLSFAEYRRGSAL